MVDVVGDVGCEPPVVCRVLEEVRDRHRRVRETVDEDRLKQALDVEWKWNNFKIEFKTSTFTNYFVNKWRNSVKKKGLRGKALNFIFH